MKSKPWQQFNQKANVEFLLDKSWHSDGHAVYMKIIRSNSLEYGYKLISVHNSILDAYSALKICRKVFSEIELNLFSRNNYLLNTFIRELKKRNDYESDDAEYLIDKRTGKKTVLKELIKKQYTVKSMADGLFLVIVDKPEYKMGHVFSSYFSAAYFADFLNDNPNTTPNEELVSKLLYESNKIQGKI